MLDSTTDLPLGRSVVLKRPNRLKSPKGFRRALNGQRLCSNGLFGVFGVPHYGGNGLPPRPTRFGLIVSKKIDKRAVRRNRIKRQLREVIRTQVLPQCNGVLNRYGIIVIVVRTGILKASYREIQHHLLQCLKK